MSTNRIGAYAAIAAISLIWGTTFAAIRVAIETIPTLLVAGIRFLIAGTLLLLVATLMRARFPKSAREWGHHAIAGVLMAGAANTLVVYAQHSLTSGMAALFAATIPIWMAVMEAILGITSLTRRTIAGLLLGFGGVALLVAPAIGQVEVSTRFLLAVGAMQLNAICWNGGTLISRRHRANADPMALAVVQMLAGGAAILLLALVSGEPPTRGMFSMRSSIALLYLAIFGSVIAYSAYNFAQTKLTASQVSSYAYICPAIAVITGALLLREPVALRMIAAMIVILAGVVLIQIDRAPAVRPLR